MSNYPVKFGKYLLLERVNVGGMAEVFKAKTFGVAGFERILAIKRILPNLVEDDEFIRMFIDEARIAVQLNHSNIVQIYELGKHGEHYYIAMEYVPSRDLRAILDRMRSNGQLMPIPQAAYVTKKVCEGLDYAHKKRDPSGNPMNIIHRDVSPQNILVGFEGEVKVIDFGIAKAANRASKTQAGVLKGKFGYMSPEQVRGLPTDRRSDIFAVGVLLYEMLTGERLFIGESDFSTLERVRNADVAPPTQFNKKISPALEQVVLKSLAREVEDRYQWASELAAELEPFLTEDKQVYTMKRIAAGMKETYAAEIALERQKLEDFLKVTADDAKPERGGPATSSILPLHGPETDPHAADAHTVHRTSAVSASEPEERQVEEDEEDLAAGFGEDKTFVIEASTAGLALQNQLTEDPARQPSAQPSPNGRTASLPSTSQPRGSSGPNANPRIGAGGKNGSTTSHTAPKPAAKPEPTNDDYLQQVSLYDDENSEEDDSRTLVSAANPFFDDKNNKTGEEDDEIDASEAQDNDAPPPPMFGGRTRGGVQEELSDAPTMAAPAGAIRTAPELGPLHGAQSEASATRTAYQRSSGGNPKAPAPPPSPPGLPLDPVAAAMAEEERMALEVLKGTTGGRGESRGQLQSPRNTDVAGNQVPSSDVVPYDATQQGPPIESDYTAPPSQAYAESNETDVMPSSPHPAAVTTAIPPHLMKMMMGLFAAAVVCFLVVVGVLVVKYAGRGGDSTVELYAIGDVEPPGDLVITLDDQPVGGLGTPFVVKGQQRLRITGTGIRPVTRVVRSTGAPMKQPVLLVAEKAAARDPAPDATDPATGPTPTPGPNPTPSSGKTPPDDDKQAATVVATGGWRLSLAAVADDTGKPLVGADVLVDGELLGRTPLEVELDPSLDQIKLRIKKDGYVMREVPLTRGERAQVGPATVRLVPGGGADPTPTATDPATDPPTNPTSSTGAARDPEPTVVAKADPPKTDPAPRTDPAPKADPPRTDAPKTDAPKTDPPKTDPGKGPKAPRPTTTLQIGTQPFAETSIDGRIYGSTPFYNKRALTLPIGKHKLEFFDKAANKKYRYELNIQAPDPENKLVIVLGKADPPRVTGKMTVKALP